MLQEVTASNRSGVRRLGFSSKIWKCLERSDRQKFNLYRPGAEELEEMFQPVERRGGIIWRSGRDPHRDHRCRQHAGRRAAIRDLCLADLYARKLRTDAHRLCRCAGAIPKDAGSCLFQGGHGVQMSMHKQALWAFDTRCCLPMVPQR